MKLYIKFISAFICMIMFLSCSPLGGIIAFAATSGECGENARWIFDSATGSLTISGSGEIRDNPWREKQDKIRTVKINNGITAIYGFDGCSNLKNVTIPNTVTKIYDCAFYGCTSLTKIVIPDSVLSIDTGAFEECTNLRTAVIGNGVNYIGEHAFAFCEKLENVKFGQNLKTIEDSAFNFCTALTSVSIPDSVVIIGKEAFMACENVTSVKIGNGVKTIGDLAFCGCNLSSLSLGNSIETIGDGAFLFCSEISNAIVFPNTLVSIGNAAFEACYEVPYFDLGNSVETIGQDAFRGCAKNIIIPASVKSIGSQAFFDAGQITVDKNNKYYSSDSRGVLFNKDKTELIQYPRLRTGNSYTVPSTVTKIGDYAFYADYCLEKVILSNNLKTIGYGAFAGSCIKDLVIPDSVTEIGERAFSNTDLENVVLGRGLTSILKEAFYNCNKITEVSYAGSSADFSAVDVKTGNEDLVDNYTYSDTYQTPSFDWAVLRDLLKNRNGYSSIKVIVKAIDKETGQLVVVPNAEVLVMDGDKEFYSDKTDENGTCNIIFNNQIFVEKMLLKNLKVSANYELDNGLYLCSETINSKGYWIGESYNNYINKEMVLIIDEPRWYVPQLNVLVNKSEETNAIKFLKQYSSDFAQATNGHVIANKFKLTVVPDKAILLEPYGTALEPEEVEQIAIKLGAQICLAYHPKGNAWAGLGFDDTDINNIFKHSGSLGLLNGGYGRNDRIIWCPINDNEPKTLCHESGHYLFGFLDEYCSAIGAFGTANKYWTIPTSLDCSLYYVYDSIELGKKSGEIEKSEVLGAYWDDNGGVIPRPDGAPENFGLMERERADGKKGLEMSTKNSYSKMNNMLPRSTTVHYFYTQASCEEKLAYVLDLKATKNGKQIYKTNYSYADDNQYARFSNEVDIEVEDTTKKSVEQIVLNSDNLLHLSEYIYGLCIFDFSDSLLNITSEHDVNIAVNDILGNALDSAVLDESNGRKYSFETTEDYYDITVSGVVDGVSYSNRYSVRIDTVDSDRDFSNEHETVNLYSETEGKAAIISPYNKEKTVNGEYTSVFNEYIVCAENSENVTGHLSSSVSRDLDIDYSSLTWFYKADDEWVALDTYNGTGEHFTPESSCAFAGNGTYCLMAKSAVETVYSVPTDVVASTENVLYDNEVNLAFNDTNENILHYNIYYGTEPITAENCSAMEKQIAYPEAKSANITLPDSETTYYFAVQAVGNDGGKSALSECVTGKGTLVDNDGDGLPDCWVNQYPALLELDDVPGTDSDEDGLTNLQEYKQGTNPLNPDTDGDNVYDGTEIAELLNPLELMSDGVTDDYVVVYGNPDVAINTSLFTFDEENVICTIENNGDGKAMRTFISLYNSDDELIQLHEVNIDSNSYIDYEFSKEYLSDGVKIVIDEDKITRDSDYANNEFTYNPLTSITAIDSEQTLTKSTKKQLEYTCNSLEQADILTWESSDEKVLSVDNVGNITCNSIGSAVVTVTTSLGYSSRYNILVEPFEGAGLTDFDCQLINNNSAVEITGYVGDSENVVIPDKIADISVVSVSENAFVGNTGISSIAFHSGITSISTAAFNGCSSITDVYYDGSRYNFNKIAAETGNGSLYDANIHCSIIPAIAKEGAVLDCESGFAYGLSAGLDSLDDYTNIELNGYYWEYTQAQYGFGTGATALLTNGETVIDGYTILIFGDVNGDGWYDSEDAFMVRLLAEGMITREHIGEAAYMAADANHDGVIDDLDADLLNGASLKLNEVDQSASGDELAEQTAYIEYLSLIDQTAGFVVLPDTDDAQQPAAPGTDEETQTDETNTDESETDNSHPGEAENKTDIEFIITNIIDFFNRIFNLIFSFIIK